MRFFLILLALVAGANIGEAKATTDAQRCAALDKGRAGAVPR